MTAKINHQIQSFMSSSNILKEISIHRNFEARKKSVRG